MKIRNNAFIVEKERGEEIHAIEIKDDDEIIVLGNPPAESENQDANTHNCDEMGCGYLHVLFRGFADSGHGDAYLECRPKQNNK